MPLPVDDKFILEAEQNLGIKLPNSYKGRMRIHNGGEIEAMDDVWQVYPVFDTSDRRRIIKTSNHIVREATVARQWPSFPPKAVPFASNGSGDLLVFLPDEEDKSQLSERIYYWNHETGESEQIADDLADMAS